MSYIEIPKLSDPGYKPGRTCVFCGNKFSNPKNSNRKSQVIWIRKVIRTANTLFRIHGSVDASCNDRINTMQVAQLAS